MKKLEPTVIILAGAFLLALILIPSLIGCGFSPDANGFCRMWRSEAFGTIIKNSFFAMVALILIAVPIILLRGKTTRDR